MKGYNKIWGVCLLLAGWVSACTNEASVGMGTAPCQDQSASQLLVGQWRYAASFTVEDASHTTDTIPKQGPLVFEQAGTLDDPNHFFLATYKTQPVVERRYALRKDTLRLSVMTRQDTLVLSALLETKSCNRLVLGHWFDGKTASPGLSLTLTR